MTIQLNVNGQIRETDADPETPLLWVLRNKLGVLGPKFGCGIAQCGACTVHVDGNPVRSCVTPVSSLPNGAKVQTIEAMSADAVGARLQAAWTELDVAQCGYCQPGQIMSATALLKVKPKPTDADIDAAMVGNLCRCATYLRIRAAIKLASGQVEA
jgi:isoquinoline 1-oxidoreductase alpha subunit